MKELFYRFIDTLFSDKVNNAVCYTAIGLTIAFTLFQAVRYMIYF